MLATAATKNNVPSPPHPQAARLAWVPTNSLPPAPTKAATATATTTAPHAPTTAATKAHPASLPHHPAATTIAELEPVRQQQSLQPRDGRNGAKTAMTVPQPPTRMVARNAPQTSCPRARRP